MKAVIESRLRADTRNERVQNLNFALWCCRALWLKEGIHAIGSHLINTWYMDDKSASERAAGMGNPWVWEPGVMHFFFTDRGTSPGMEEAWKRCERDGIPMVATTLAEYHPESYAAFQRGEWPPHTEGFEVR